MYSNLAKTHAFPLVFRAPSTKARNFKQLYTLKPQSYPLGFHLNPQFYPNYTYSTAQFLSFVKSQKLEIGRAGSRKVNESSKKKGKVAVASLWEESARRLDKTAVTETETEKTSSSWDESAKRSQNGGDLRSARFARKDSEVPKKSYYTVRNGENRNGKAGGVKDREYGSGYKERNGGNLEEREGKEDRIEEELDVADDDPRWDKIRNKFAGNRRGRVERSESLRWNREENWGRKTWKEATESSVPRIIGEGVYGVGPVLAALSSGRREFYALYVQEGLDLSSNNKKKKDKKGFEKVLWMAEKIGLAVKEISKHDLNMVVDNRPHQGLVLDASPLEMVKIMELDQVSEDERGSLWVALDEVTDPQNLGAIIRSAYFFGASGVILCAKNSAPLSGVVSKASAGSLELMELRYCKNMMQFLVSSAENGWRVLGGSVASRAVPLNEVSPGQPTILVLGSEGTGLRPLVERSCTQLVQIPGNIPMDVTVGENGDGFESKEANIERTSEEFRSFMAVESLNVSVAAGVLLHHLIGTKPQ
ncbi:rRNA methyltransferase 1 mitochondrial [Euphorbia peplus]|nr:rRNA methyltransferase 1 mitochondrial [Euphorbia peplus]